MLTLWSRLGSEFTSSLQAVGIDGFERLDWLPWLALVVAAPLLLTRRARAPAIAWPAASQARLAGARQRDALPWIAGGLRFLCLLCLTATLAGPVARRQLPPEPGLGLDVILVLDASRSMGALDTTLTTALRGQGPSPLRTRFDLARQAVSRFAGQRVAEGDRLGLVVFGSSAFTQCPLTTDSGLLLAALRLVEVGIAGESTALGDALALAVVRASAADDDAPRLVVLLTDGRSNTGDVPVSVASELAAAAGVRVHTVGIGGGGREVAIQARDTASLELRYERHDPDHATLARVARNTGGRFFAARGSQDLQAVYDEIGALERGARALPPRVHQTSRPAPLLAAAGALLAVEILLARLLLRRLP